MRPKSAFPERFVTLGEVCEQYRDHRATIYRLIDAGKFPRPIVLDRKIDSKGRGKGKLLWLPGVLAKHQATLARRAADADRKAAKRQAAKKHSVELLSPSGSAA